MSHLHTFAHTGPPQSSSALSTPVSLFVTAQGSPLPESLAVSPGLCLVRVSDPSVIAFAAWDYDDQCPVLPPARQGAPRQGQ